MIGLENNDTPSTARMKKFEMEVPPRSRSFSKAAPGVAPLTPLTKRAVRTRALASNWRWSEYLLTGWLFIYIVYRMPRGQQDGIHCFFMLL